MEGTPFVVEKSNEDDDEEKRKAKIKKPENLGILAVESPEEPQLSPLEKVIAALREPAPEAEKKPEAEEEPIVLPETEPPVERVPEEDARRIVHEMVAEQPAETEEEPEPEAESEPTLEPELEIEPEPEPVVTAETTPIDEPIKAAEEEPVVEPETVERIEPEPAPEPEAETEPAPEPEVETPEPETEPETPPDTDDKKPGFIRSLFRRRERDKPEPEVEPEPEPEAETEPAPEPEVETPADEPEFQFTERTEEPVEKPKAEEAPEEPETPRKPEAKPEQIGQMLLNTEAISAEQQPKPVAEAVVSSQEAEKKLKVEASPIEPVSGKRIDTLNRAELMDLAATITIDGNNLRHIYETHLIGERGLRRLVAEHIRGGDLPKALRHEVLEHEMDFERDPVMRNIAPLTTATLGGSNHAALEQLLQKADASLADNGEQTAVFQAQAHHEATNQQRHYQQRRLLDVMLVTVISILMVSIMLIYLIQR
jgi:hypothetical protein